MTSLQSQYEYDFSDSTYEVAEYQETVSLFDNCTDLDNGECEYGDDYDYNGDDYETHEDKQTRLQIEQEQEQDRVEAEIARKPTEVEMNEEFRVYQITLKRQLDAEKAEKTKKATELVARKKELSKWASLMGICINHIPGSFEEKCEEMDFQKRVQKAKFVKQWNTKKAVIEQKELLEAKKERNEQTRENARIRRINGKARYLARVSKMNSQGRIQGKLQKAKALAAKNIVVKGKRVLRREKQEKNQQEAQKYISRIIELEGSKSTTLSQPKATDVEEEGFDASVFLSNTSSDDWCVPKKQTPKKQTQKKQTPKKQQVSVDEDLMFLSTIQQTNFVVSKAEKKHTPKKHIQPEAHESGWMQTKNTKRTYKERCVKRKAAKAKKDLKRAIWQQQQLVKIARLAQLQKQEIETESETPTNTPCQSPHNTRTPTVSPWAPVTLVTETIASIQKQEASAPRKSRWGPPLIQKPHKSRWDQRTVQRLVFAVKPTTPSKKAFNKSKGTRLNIFGSSLIQDVKDQRVSNDPRYAARTSAFETLSDKNLVDKKLTCTRMCRSVLAGTKCRHSHCRFAHSVDQLVKKQCMFGKSCKFVHEESQGAYSNNKGYGNHSKVCDFWHPEETEHSYSSRIGVSYKKQVEKEQSPEKVIVIKVPKILEEQVTKIAMTQGKKFRIETY